MFVLALVPFVAGCFWNKKETVETTAATEVMAEPVVNPEETPSEEMPGMADNVSAEMSDEK